MVLDYLGTTTMVEGEASAQGRVIRGFKKIYCLRRESEIG